LRRMIIKEQTPRRDLAKTQPVAVGERRMGRLIGPIEPQTCRDEPEDRRFAGPVKAGALFAYGYATHCAKRRMEQEDEVLAHGCHHLVAMAIASVRVPSPPTFMVYRPSAHAPYALSMSR
jgi:hypothetical protein